MLRISKRNTLWVLCIALLLRAVLVISVLIKNPDGIWVFDSYGYWQIAYNLVTNGIYSQDYTLPLYPDSLRTPLYPLLMAFFQMTGAGSHGMLFLQVILSSLTAVITANLTLRIFKCSRTAIIAGLIVALDIPSVIFTGLILTETIFTFLFIATIYSLVVHLERKDARSLIGAGTLHALAMLCRPVATITFIIILLVLFFSARQLKAGMKKAAVWCITVLLILSPWLARNKIVFDSFFLSTISSHLLHNYHAASIISEKNAIPFHDAQLALREDAYKTFKRNVMTEADEYAGYCRARAVKIIIDNKSVFIKQHLFGVISLSFKPVRGYIDNMLGYTKGYQSASPSEFPATSKTYRIVKELSSKLSFGLLIVQIFFIVIIYAGLLRGIVWWWKKNDRTILIMLLLIIAYFLNTTVPPFNEARFRVPVMPVIAIISSCGLNIFIGYLKRLSR